MEVICALVFASWLVCQADLLEESLPQRPHHIRWQVVHDPDEHFSKALNDVWAVNSLHHHLQHHRFALSHQQPAYAQAYGMQSCIKLFAKHAVDYIV